MSDTWLVMGFPLEDPTYTDDERPPGVAVSGVRVHKGRFTNDVIVSVVQSLRSEARKNGWTVATVQAWPMPTEETTHGRSRWLNYGYCETLYTRGGGVRTWPPVAGSWEGP